jgi:hypothetical protein
VNSPFVLSPSEDYVALKAMGEERATWFSILLPITPFASWHNRPNLERSQLLDLIEELLPAGSQLERDSIWASWDDNDDATGNAV